MENLKAIYTFLYEFVRDDLVHPEWSWKYRLIGGACLLTLVVAVKVYTVYRHVTSDLPQNREQK